MLEENAAADKIPDVLQMKEQKSPPGELGGVSLGEKTLGLRCNGAQVCRGAKGTPGTAAFQC